MRRIISLFSGVGGIELPFVKNEFAVVFANDFEPKAIKTYNLNFEINALCADISKINPDNIPDGDILVGGFPCQPFSVAGYRKGFEDTRGTLFFNVCKILEAKRPAVVLLENVKNLVSHDSGKTFEVILNSLENLGYHVKHAVLNACEYGNMPQNRERIYIVGFLNASHYKNFEFPNPVRLKTSLADLLDFKSKVDDKYYYTKKKYPRIYNAFTKEKPIKGVVYQWRRQYVRANKSNLCPCLTANMGTGGHNVPLIYTDYGLRKLTPRECFNVQGFPKSYKLPTDLADSALYKQAGNSVCVGVIDRIAENIIKAMEQ
jgi:DNA (cytosine-5)-methyltransferase 1